MTPRERRDIPWMVGIAVIFVIALLIYIALTN